jgi:carbon-monoxide dehydrogenase medium subunit
MYETIYLRAATLDQALAWLSEHEDAKPLSGGMTLIPTLKQRLAAPSHLIDLTRIETMRGVSVESIESEDGVKASVLRIGALTRHAEVAASPVVAAAIPALSQLANVIADPQVRNRGTMGGSVANNDPAADYPSAVLALNAQVITSQRRIAADDFFIDTFETSLEPGEIVTGFEYPLPLRAAYAKFRQPASGYAVVGVFIAQFADAVRVAVTGAGASVFRWREAEAALHADLSEAALAGLKMDAGVLPDDANGSSAYRAHLIETYTRRSLQALLAQSLRDAA